MIYLLDTNACMALIDAWPQRVGRRYERTAAAGGTAAVSTITAFELRYGAARSTRKQSNLDRLDEFLAGPIALLPFDDGDAEIAAAVRTDLEARGRPIGPYDVLIAGQALRREMTLVTANVAEFSRVRGLKWQDWAK